MGNVLIKTSSGTENVLPERPYGSATEVVLNKNIIIRCGYKEITNVPSVNTVPLFSLDELSQMMGVTITDPYKIIAIVENARSDYQSAHFQSCGYYATRVYNGITYNNVWALRADRAMSGTLACTYAFIYFNDSGISTGAYMVSDQAEFGDGVLNDLEELQTGYDAKGIKKMIAGSQVITLSNNNSKQVHNEASMNSLLGSGCNNKNTLAYYCNGDGTANGCHIDGCTFVPDDGSWRIVLTNGTTATGSVRVNYILFRW